MPIFLLEHGLFGGRGRATFASVGAREVDGGVNCSQGGTRWPKRVRIAAPAAGSRDRTVGYSKAIAG